MALSPEEKAAIDRDMRQYGLETGSSFAEFFETDVLDVLESGAVGIVADARDVNGIALAGVIATWDETTTPGTSLAFGWREFRFHNGKALVLVGSGTIGGGLSPSTVNYIEVDRAGTVSKNTTGFTSGRLPLFQVTTGAATYEASDVVGRATPYVLIGDDGVDGSMLSVAGQTKEVAVTIGTISATGAFCVIVPNTIAAGSKLTKASFVSKDALAANDTNYFDFGLVNKQTGAGSQTLADRTAAANSTKVTGGSAIVAYTKRDLTLVTLTVGTERDVTGGHVLEFTVTKTAAPSNLTQCYLLLEFTFEN